MKQSDEDEIEYMLNLNTQYPEPYVEPTPEQEAFARGFARGVRAICPIIAPRKRSVRSNSKTRETAPRYKYLAHGGAVQRDHEQDGPGALASAIIGGVVFALAILLVGLMLFGRGS